MAGKVMSEKREKILHGNIAQRACMESVLCEQLLHTSLFMMTDSMEGPLSGQAGFKISKTIRCFWRTWPARSLDLAVPDYYFRGCLKSTAY
jgi:hypothetical protein